MNGFTPIAFVNNPPMLLITYLHNFLDEIKHTKLDQFIDKDFLNIQPQCLGHVFIVNLSISHMKALSMSLLIKSLSVLYIFLAHILIPFYL